MNDNVIILLVGKSGVGKSTLANYMTKEWGWREVLSYTTRPPRFPGENTHLFVNNERFGIIQDKENICAYTEFDGYRYGATDREVDNADIYVIDPDGVEYFRKAYKGRKIPIVVYLDAPVDLLMERMYVRGDKAEQIYSRVRNDNIKFKDFRKDYVIDVVDENGNELDVKTLGIELFRIKSNKEREIRRLEEMLP